MYTYTCTFVHVHTIHVYNKFMCMYFYQGSILLTFASTKTMHVVHVHEIYNYVLQGVSSLRSLSPCTCVEVFEWYG